MSAPSTLYLDRASVRVILIHAGSAKLLAAVDALPIVTAADLRAPHPAPTSDGLCYCSFCGRTQHEVEVMLAGAVLTFMCDQCVELAVETVAAKRAELTLEREAVAGAVDRGNAILSAQAAAREADPRPSEQIIRKQRDEWNKGSAP